MAYNLSENLTIQLQLLEPTAANIGAIRKQLEAGLKGINIGSLDTKNFVKANAEVNNLSKTFDKGQEKAKGFFDAVEGKARGFAAYTVASTAILKLTGAISQATREAIKYEAELLKISQVTGDSVNRTKDLSRSLFDISKQYNVNISKVAQLTRTLTQTGLSFREAAKGAEVLARTSLLATFDNLTNTTEGLIAVMQTFNLTVKQSGDVLEKINAVSKAFAVESSDIVEAIRRTGGAFSSAGGQVEELIALFTSVRSTSRESAETIATGFRTIFGRLQRPKTIEYFKQLGIQLETAEGQFIGPLKAIEAISKGLDRLNISAGSTRFAEVVEQIGGIRQISRVIPLLEQYRKTQDALDIQNKSSAESYKDIEKAQKGLGFQLGQLKQEFGELIAEFVNSGSFKVIAKTFIGFTRTIISLTKALKPLLPLITAIATVKLGRGISQLVSGGLSLKGLKGAMGFARGGVVPGSGNGDTVPAMLTPGEFVVRKSAVQAFGASNLAKINKYAQGGVAKLTTRKPSISKYYDTDLDQYDVNPIDISLVKRRKEFRDDAKKIWDKAVQEKDPNAYIYKKTKGFAGSGSQTLGPKELDASSSDERRLNKIAGALTELAVKKILGNAAKKLSDKSGPDFQNGNEFFEVKSTLRKVPDEEIVAKAVLGEGIRQNGKLKDGSKQTVKPKITHIRAMSKGGGVGTDTVPALLTPGEFVVNKKSAQAFGYNNLRKINKYASGGTVDGVEVQRFGDGDVVLTKEQKKQRREQWKSEQLGTSLTRGERTGGWQKEIIAKYSKLIAEEKAAIQKVYAEKIKNAIAEKKSIAGIVKQKNAAQADSEKAITMGMNRAISDKGADIAAKELSDKLKKASQELVILTDNAKDAADSAKDITDANKKLAVTIPELIFYAEAAANSLEQFVGLNINREALEAGKVKAGQFDILSKIADKFNVENIDKFSRDVKSAGQTVGKMGDKIGGRFGKVLSKAGSGLEKFGGKLFANAGKLAKLGRGVSIISGLIARIELLGGFIDSLFSKNYSKIRDRAIATGDVEGAGDAALKAYNQEFLRGIPIIGGVLSAFQEYIPFLNFEADARGRLIVATAQAQASIVRFDKEMQNVSSDLSSALIANNPEKIREALNAQKGLINDLTTRGEDLKAKAKEAGSANPLARVASGVVSGATVGAGIGGTAGAFLGGVGAGPGAVIGGVIGGVVGGVKAYVDTVTKGSAEIVAAYQTAGELFEKAGIEASKRIEFFGDQLTSTITSIVLAGGSIEEAFAAFKEKFGEGALKEIFKGADVNSLESLEAASEAVDQELKNTRDGIVDLTQKLNTLNNEIDNGGWWGWITGATEAKKAAAAEAEQQKKEQEAKQLELETAKKVAAQVQQAAKNASILAAAREAENAAMRESIALINEMNKVFDRLNKSFYAAESALDSVRAAQSGGLSRSQVLSGTGISDRTLRMSGEEVMRDDSAFNELAGAIDKFGSQLISNNIRQGKKQFDAINSLMDNNNNADLIAEISAIKTTTTDVEGTGQAAYVEKGVSIADALQKRLEAAGVEVSDTMRAALEKVGKNVAEGADVGVELEKMKKELSEEQIKILEETQKKYEQYIQMEQELQQLKIEQINKEHQLQQKVYDAEMDYLNKRLALSEKVDDVLDEGPVGKGRAGFLKQRGEQRRANRMAGIGAARQRSGLPANTRGAEQTTINSLNNLDPKLDTFGETLADLTGQGERLLATLQDEIAAEQDYLDSLIETAKAQQEYTQALNDAQGDLVRDLVTGTQEEQANTLSTLNAAAYSAMQGSFQGIPEDMKKDIFSIFDQFGDVEIPGLGMTGRDAQRNITKNELMQNWGLDEATADQMASKAVKDRVPIDERMKEMIELQEKKILELLAIENQLKQALLMGERANNERFAMAVSEFAASVADLKASLGVAAPGQNAPDQNAPPQGQAPDQNAPPQGQAPDQNVPPPQGQAPDQNVPPPQGQAPDQNVPPPPQQGVPTNQGGTIPPTPVGGRSAATNRSASNKCECIEKAIEQQTQQLVSNQAQGGGAGGAGGGGTGTGGAGGATGGVSLGPTGMIPGVGNVADETGMVPGVNNVPGTGAASVNNNAGGRSGLSNAAKAAASATGGLVGKFGPKLFKAGKDALPGLMSSLGRGTKGIRDYAAGKAGAAGDFLSKQFKNVTGKFKGGPATNKTPQLFDIFKRVDANKKSVGKFGKDFAQRLGADYGLDPKQMEALFKPSDVKTGKATDKILMEAAKRQKTGVTAGVTRNSNQLYIKSGKGIEGGVLQHELGHVAQNNLAKTNKAGALALRGQSKTMQPMIEEFLSNPKGYEALKGKTKGMYSADFIRNKPDELFTEMMRKVGTDDFNNNPMAQKLFKTYLSEAGIGPKPPTALQQIGSKASGMVDRFKTGAGAAKDYIGGGLKTAKDYLGGKFDAVKGLAGKLPGAGLVSNLVNRGKDAAGFVGSKLGAAGSFLGKGVGKAMPLLGPALGGAFGYMAPTEQSADPDNPYADALSNRNSYANAAFGLLGAGPTTMGDVGAQSSLGWALGVDQGSMMDKQLGNWSQFATGTMQNLAMGNVAAPLTTAGAMVGQETVGLIEDKKKQWAGERKTDRMESNFEKTQLGNENFKDMPYLNAQQMILKNEERVAKENAGKFKKAVEEGRGDEQAGPGGLITNKQALESANRQVAEKQVAFENSLNPGQKETIKQFESIKAGREQFNQQQAAAKRQKAEKYQSYRDKYGEDLSDEDIQLFESTKNRKAIFNKEGKREGVDILPGPFEQKLIDKQEKAKEAQEAATQQATTPIAGTASGVGAMTLSDKPQTFGSMIDEEIQQEKLGGASYDPFADVTSAPKSIAADTASTTVEGTSPVMGVMGGLAGAAMGGISNLMNTGGGEPAKTLSPEQLANRSRINRIGRMRAGKTGIMDKMQLSGNRMLKQGELSPEMQDNIAAGQSMLSNITDGNLMGGVMGGVNNLINKGAQVAGGLLGGTDKSASAGGAVGIPGAIYGGMVADPKKHKPVKEFTRDKMGTTVGSDAFKGGLWSPQALGSPTGEAKAFDDSMKQMYNTIGNNFDSHRQDGRNAAPNIPAQVASQSRTSNLLGAGQNNNSNGTGTGYGGGGGMGGGGPIQVNTTGTQEIIVRLPDIQAIVNQSITSLIYQTVGETFNNIASKVATNQNFEDLQRTFSEGVTETQTKQVNSSSTIGGK